MLTRTLMVFGQGAIRCHPFARLEIESLARGDRAAFDKAFFAHVGHVMRNAVRATLLSLTRGWLTRSPVRGPTATHWRRLAWASASFAIHADLAMAGLGGDLKRKEKITGRFADVFSWMMLITATLRRYEAEGKKAEDLPLVHWCCEQGFARISLAMQGLSRNLRIPFATWFFKGPLALWGRINPLGHGPHDALGHKAARTILAPGAQRDRLTAGIALEADAARGRSRTRVCGMHGGGTRAREAEGRRQGEDAAEGRTRTPPRRGRAEGRVAPRTRNWCATGGDGAPRRDRGRRLHARRGPCHHGEGRPARALSSGFARMPCRAMMRGRAPAMRSAHALVVRSILLLAVLTATSLAQKGVIESRVGLNSSRRRPSPNCRAAAIAAPRCGCSQHLARWRRSSRAARTCRRCA